MNAKVVLPALALGAALLGAALGAAVGVVAARSLPAPGPAGHAGGPEAAAAAIGRYEMHQSPLDTRDTFVLDTATGRIWQLVEDDDGAEYWEEMERTDDSKPALPKAQKLSAPGLKVRGGCVPSDAPARRAAGPTRTAGALSFAGRGTLASWRFARSAPWPPWPPCRRPRPCRAAQYAHCAGARLQPGLR
jgi:hypothetical protein